MSVENFAVFKKPPSKVWIVALSAAMFVPMMGRGFVHDDYLLLTSSAFGLIRTGLTRADIFYTPVTWLTFKADWMLWGPNPFALAAVNLVLHIANILLLYHVALRFSRSSVAAWWTAFGFALLFPANTWAVMWLATRAHLLVTAFDLAAMTATFWFIRTKKSRLLPAIAIVAFATLSIFSKESGITVPVIVGLVLIHDRISRARRTVPLVPVIGLFCALAGIGVAYMLLRAQSGAAPIQVGDGTGHTYALSPKVLIENTLRYSWRTFGLLSLLAGAIALSQFIRGQRPSLKGILKKDVLFSAVLFIVTLSPVVLMRSRSGIYTYLAGISAALLFGLTVRTLLENEPGIETATKLRAILAPIPILIVVAIFITFTIGYSKRWKVMGETDSSVLNQIAAQQNSVPNSSLIVLTYDRADAVHRFPEGFGEWGFGYGIKILFRNPSADGAVVQKGAPLDARGMSPLIHFDYRLDGNGMPLVVRTGEE